MKIRLINLTFLLLVSGQIFSQQFVPERLYFEKQKIETYDSISIITVLERAIAIDSDSTILIKTRRLDIEIPQEKFMFEDSVVYKHLLGKFPNIKLNEIGQIVIPNYLRLEIDSMNIVPLSIEGFEFARGVFLKINGSSRDLQIEACTFNDLGIFILKDGLALTNNNFKQGLYISNETGRLNIEDNQISTPVITLKVIEKPFESYSYAIDIRSPSLDYFSFSNNKVNDERKNGSISNFRLEKVGVFAFSENTIDGIVDLSGVLVERRVNLKDNVFNGSICLSDFIFPEHFNKIYWDQLAGRKLNIIKKMASRQYGGLIVYPYNSTTDSLVDENHKDLIMTYKALHSIFVDNGDTESANGVYAEKKDLEGTRLKYLYEKFGGFRPYINYKLNRLLKFYTNHGTDPALAILISIYVLLGFAVFYMFFPSDWDITSKSRLLRNFNDFRQKNEKGYIKPFLFITWVFFLSFVNALTLSINSFVTLGFGNIPTKGAARYVCIIQGFIGWFLLSIFTVALINQVLS